MIQQTCKNQGLFGKDLNKIAFFIESDLKGSPISFVAKEHWVPHTLLLSLSMYIPFPDAST